MNNDTLIVVHSYAGDQQQVEAFLPVYLHHGRPVLILSPDDAPTKIVHAGVENRHAGFAGWKGPQTIHRQIAHWKLALEEEWSWVLLNDSDSMCLTPDLPAYLYSNTETFWCNVLCHENEHREDDHPNLNPPYFTHRSVLERLVEEADKLGEIPQDAFLEPHDWGQAIDGFYTHLVMDILKIPYGDYPDGITTWPRGRPDLFKYTAEGARMIHGVKTSQDLDHLLLNHRAWEMVQERDRPIPLNTGFFEGDTVTV